MASFPPWLPGPRSVAQILRAAISAAIQSNAKQFKAEMSDASDHAHEQFHGPPMTGWDRIGAVRTGCNPNRSQKLQLLTPPKAYYITFQKSHAN